MIRELRESDLPRLKELHNGFDWTFGPDFMAGMVATDSQDRPVIFAGAWSRAEVHLAIDASWETAGIRYALLLQIHDAMEREMKARGIGQAVTWFEKTEAFCRRLIEFGWVKSHSTSYHKEIR